MRILSGVQPTGSIHIGAYAGAISQWNELQTIGECIFFIADLHALTVPQKPDEFPKQTLNTAIELIAAGLDPGKCIIFVQSQIKEHAELCWMLNTVTPLGELERMTQYKEKSKQFKNNINAGLLDYPVLQAADILLYQTESVPVGKDQQQHLELTKSIARKFNQRYGETFKVPEALVLKIGAKIMALNDPKKKMSKSSPQGCLYLFDEPEIIRKKIMSAVTDTGKKIKYDPVKKAGISNLLTIYSVFSGQSILQLEKKFGNKGYADLKKQLAELLTLKLEPYRRKKKELLSREVYVKEILEQGRKRAESIAKSTMAQVRKEMGLF